MTEAVIRRPMRPPQVKRASPKPRPEHVNLYPLQKTLLFVAVGLGLVTFAALDWLSGLSVFTLFALIGFSWRRDMPPIIPACMAFQWTSASSGYLYLQITGIYPGNDIMGEIELAVLYSLVGLAAVALGLRVVLRLFAPTLLAKTTQPPRNYSIRRLFTFCLAAFAVSYVFDLAPRAIWFGGAQLIETALALRFVPYFLLVVTVFEQRRGYSYLVGASAWVLGPQLLTGFSDFKVILFVLLIAALSQWRPWVRSKAQARRNLKILLYGLIGSIVVLMAGLVWSGGVKSQWRDRIWREDVTDVSPIERMGEFFTVVGDVTSDLDMRRSSEILAGRLSSGVLYFSYVLERVPSTVAHENGYLIGRAILNAVQPRFLFPNKVDLGGDSWIVRRYAGMAVAGDQEGTSIGLGYLAEFYIDFGVWGVLGLAFLWGAFGGITIIAMARFSPSREILLALVIALFVAYFMTLDGSFIKLFAGMMQRTIVGCAVFALAGKPLIRWLIPAPPRAAAPGGALRPAGAGRTTA